MRLSKTSKLIVITLAVVVLLTGCGLPTGNERPDDKKLREGILLLMTSYERYHSEVINFDKTKVKAQISKKLPAGEATQAGWSIKWSNYITGELPSVVIPWVILGQYPQTFKTEYDAYSGGHPVPQAIAQEIAKQQEPLDEFFSAVVNQRISIKDPRWIIFSAIPYLPVTDPGYGFAQKSGNTWKIKDFGTATVGCGIVPTEVQTEFGLSCP